MLAALEGRASPTIQQWCVLAIQPRSAVHYFQLTFSGMMLLKNDIYLCLSLVFVAFVVAAEIQAREVGLWIVNVWVGVGRATNFGVGFHVFSSRRTVLYVDNSSESGDTCLCHMHHGHDWARASRKFANSPSPEIGECLQQRTPLPHGAPDAQPPHETNILSLETKVPKLQP